MYNQGKDKSTVKCHICDSDLVYPKTDPHAPSKLLPCETCLTVITATLLKFDTEEDEDIPVELEYDDYLFDELPDPEDTYDDE